MSKRVAVINVWDGPGGRVDVSYQLRMSPMPACVRLAIDLSEASKDYLAVYMNREQAVAVGKAMLEAARRLAERGGR